MSSILIPLEWESRALVSDYLRRFPPEVSELTFTNLFVWRKSRPVWLAEIDGALVFFVCTGSGGGGTWVFGPPLGPLPAARRIREAVPEVCGFSRISADPAERYRSEGLRLLEDNDNSDYVYRTRDLIELKGERYHKKRNLVKQCLDAHACQYEAMTARLIEECRRMQDRWCEARHCDINPGLCRENEAIREIFDHYTGLDLIGGAFRVDGQVEAWAIAERLGPGTAVWHFEKAMPAIKGLGQLTTQWFAQKELAAFDFVNREQDLGVPGLRQAKQSYYPHHMVGKFTACIPDALPSPAEAAAPDAGGVHPTPAPADPRECDRRCDDRG